MQKDIHFSSGIQIQDPNVAAVERGHGDRLNNNCIRNNHEYQDQ
jgi:hypothetical protein